MAGNGSFCVNQLPGANPAQTTIGNLIATTQNDRAGQELTNG